MLGYHHLNETDINFRSSDIKFHVANSGATLNKVGTELDFIRPGSSLFGLPSGKTMLFYTYSSL